LNLVSFEGMGEGALMIVDGGRFRGLHLDVGLGCMMKHWEELGTGSKMFYFLVLEWEERSR